MENYNISVIVLLEILGGVVTFFAAWGAVHKWIIKPIKDRNAQIDKNTAEIVELKKLSKEITEMQKLQCKSQLALIDHEITGNGIENLKSIKKEMQNALIDKV